LLLQQRFALTRCSLPQLSPLLIIKECFNGLLDSDSVGFLLPANGLLCLRLTRLERTFHFVSFALCIVPVSRPRGCADGFAV
jgi:hypothetical protein